ncbi:MAG: LURP-one-related family protein [Pisciglobus halotolerans]|nr:LURP-one-related family protein [Pisciglobus halotolerans]
MELVIKQRLFSWKDRFTVKNREGEDCYFVEGEFFSWGKKLHIYDREEKEVLYIEQKLWSWLAEYSLYIDGEEQGIVRQQLTLFHPRYVIEGPDWQVEGDFWAHEYNIIEKEQVIASISKEWFSWGDSYTLSIQDESQALLALGVVLVIDCIIAAENAAASG